MSNHSHDQLQSEDYSNAWLKGVQEDAIRMSEDEEYRSLVASRATNWGKGIQQEVEQLQRQRDQPILEVPD